MFVISPVFAFVSVPASFPCIPWRFQFNVPCFALSTFLICFLSCSYFLISLSPTRHECFHAPCFLIYFLRLVLFCLFQRVARNLLNAFCVGCRKRWVIVGWDHGWICWLVAYFVQLWCLICGGT
jgi:hypothetical protein